MPVFGKIALPTTLLIFVATAACITPDRDRMRLGISRDAIHESADAGVDTRLKSDPGVDGKATIFMPQEKSGFDSFLLGLSVDSKESALHHFHSRYLGVYLNLRNDSLEPVEFDAASLVLKTEHQDLKAVPREKLPKAFERINWKGNLKNTYNAAMATVGTVAIVASVLYCLKEGECGAVVRATHSAVRLTAGYAERSRESENEVFSSVTHNTNLIYQNLLPERIVLGPGESVEGLAFFPRPKKFSIARVFWKKGGVRPDDL